MRCYELQQYLQLRQECTAVDKTAREDQWKPWRLQLKRRLSKKHEEELEAVQLEASSSTDAAQVTTNAAADRRKALLEELYQELVAEYEVLAQRLEPIQAKA